MSKRRHLVFNGRRVEATLGESLIDAALGGSLLIPHDCRSGQYEGERAEVNGWAKWKDGHWTLELVRNIKAAGKYGKDFVPGHDLYMWVAVFDHTQTRHTVHSRPVRVVLQE